MRAVFPYRHRMRLRSKPPQPFVRFWFGRARSGHICALLHVRNCASQRGALTESGVQSLLEEKPPDSANAGDTNAKPDRNLSVRRAVGGGQEDIRASSATLSGLGSCG